MLLCAFVVLVLMAAGQDHAGGSMVFGDTSSRNPDLYEGSACKMRDGSRGQCVPMPKCPSALLEFKKDRRKFRPLRCGFEGFTEIICCADVPLRKAEEACRDFTNEINPNINMYIYGGDEAQPGEFPHMVALGYKDRDSGIRWDCGGSLISRNHVLTAAHCVTNSYKGKPVRVRVGAHNLTDRSPLTAGQELAVEDVFWHPQYSPKAHYNDIAVLKIQPAEFSDRVQPACLHTRMRAPDSGMVAAGWGVTDIDLLDKTSDVLMKAGMDQVPLSKCNASFGRSPNARLSRGVTPEMICARGSNGVADTCLGDSGGPLQVMEPGSVLYSLVGVTSFGQLCGGLGVYVRVASYLDWIESVVWPDL